MSGSRDLSAVAGGTVAQKRTNKPARIKRSSMDVRVEKVPGGSAWRLLHPRCALERVEDLEEVRAMLEGGEAEIATEELRWLLGGCPDMIAAHRILGDVSLEAGDVALARGHYGHAYRVGLAALKAGSNPAPLPYSIEANQDFLACARGLVTCLRQLGKHEMEAEVAEVLLRCDPADPLQVEGTC
ncbi:MAG: hypothetical protein K8T25_23130 [Planctomycetia bacterium]|nr:hypothetical protein [Planctomycetia bacterium]